MLFNMQLLCSVFSLDLIPSALQTEAWTPTKSTSGVIWSDPFVDVHRLTGLSCLSGPLSRSSHQVEASFIQTNSSVFFLHYVFDTSIFLTADLYLKN